VLCTVGRVLWVVVSVVGPVPFAADAADGWGSCVIGVFVVLSMLLCAVGARVSGRRAVLPLLWWSAPEGTLR
jgi:hypothetical protein